MNEYEILRDLNSLSAEELEDKHGHWIMHINLHHP